MQGKFANVAKDNQTSHSESKKDSSDESDLGEFSEREYEKDEYEVQAFIARGQREQQERAEAREARRRREEEVAPAQTSAPVPTVCRKSRTTKADKTETSSGSTVAEIRT